MNFALPALIVFVLLVPGFILQLRFKRIERTMLDYSPFGKVVTEGFFYACVIHVFWCGLAYLFHSKLCDVTILLSVLSSDASNQRNAIVCVAKQIHWVVYYFSTLLIAVYVFPALLRKCVVHFGWDRFNRISAGIFRFHDAPWYYLLTGADFVYEDRPDLIMISAIVEVAGQAYLYMGVLDEFYVNGDGVLDRVILEKVSRRPLVFDKNAASVETDGFYDVAGDYFVLRYKEIVTLNVQYFKVVEESLV
jgi:hypothetical protein